MNEPLVSIIIPTFNRAHVITETLDSILAQTYQNWECIIVDDASTDNTDDVVAEYVNKDKRFKYYHRPKERLKGGNAARNYGFEVSRGEYIQWFDSDDLMHLNKIEIKIEKLLSTNVDFVISKTQNFEKNGFQSPYKYSVEENGFNLFLFLIRHIHWYTYDCLLKRSLASQTNYFEKMKSWQDYYYFAKMLSFSTNGVFIDKVLTFRRIHENSIQDSLNKSNIEFHKNLLFAKFHTYKDLKHNLELHQQKKYFKGCITHSFYLMKWKFFSNLLPQIVRETFLLYKTRSAISLIIGYLVVYTTGKGEKLVNQIK